MTPPLRLTPLADTTIVDEINAFAPELFDFCDAQAQVTLAGNTDLDLEAFDAVDAILSGADLKKVVSYITPTHPATEDVHALLHLLWCKHRGLN